MTDEREDAAGPGAGRAAEEPGGELRPEVVADVLEALEARVEAERREALRGTAPEPPEGDGGGRGGP